MNFQSYQETLDYLYGLTKSGIKLGLKNTARLLHYFGNPQLKVRTVHIGGTNGKGSTAAFTDSILRAAGYHVGLYTSPHLLDFRERIRLDREPIGQDEVIELASRIRHAAEKLDLAVTFFEFGTVMAFLYFFEKKADWNVIEVGLGGRLDATNLCQAEVSILTSVSKDHTEYLGEDLKQIAWEKSLIIKENGTVFAHIESDSVFDVVKDVAQKRSAQIGRYGKDFNTRLRECGSQGQKIDFSWREYRLEGLELPLIGRHQAANAALALVACLELGSKNPQISEQAVREGLKTTQIEGRLEVIGDRPTVILDCAHNPDGVRKLTLTIREYFTYTRCFLVLGVMKDKPLDEMLEIFSGFADHFILCRPQSKRSEDPKELQNRLQGLHKAVEIIEEIPYALEKSKHLAKSDDLICITGSIFTVAEAKQYLAHERVPKSNPGFTDACLPGR